MGHRVIQREVAANAALTNSTAETVLRSCSLPAYSFQVGKRYRVHAQVRATATNSTDTLTVLCRIGPTTLTGTTIASSGAVDVANNDGCVFDLQVMCRSVGSTGEILVTGAASVLAAEGAATLRYVYEDKTSLDMTAAQLIEITGQWSVASASNSCICEQFVIEELV